MQHAGNADFVTGETGVWGFSALTVGLNPEFYRTAFPGHPYQVAMQRGVRMYHDQTTRPLHDMRWEMFALLSHGAFVTLIDKTGYDGWLDPVAYDRMGEVLADARSRQEHFGQPPLYQVGLYFSARTRDWVGRENPAAYFQSFLGAHKACVLEHLPLGVVMDENVTQESLRQFPIVSLSDTRIISDRELTLLKQYVEQGGNLLVTGFAGQFDRLGKPLDDSRLSELIGAHARQRLESADNWVRFSKENVTAPTTGADRADVSGLWDGIRLDWPFLVKGPATVYEPTTAVAVGELLQPHRSPRQLSGQQTTEWPMSAGQVVGPAVLVNRLGKGRVVTLAAAADFATASEHHIVEARWMFRNAVQLLDPEPALQITAPANVEAVITDDPQRRLLRVHLVAYNPTPQTTPATNRPYVLPGLIEQEPIYRASILVRRPVKDVTTVGKTLALKRDGAQVHLTIEGVHEVVVIAY